MTCHVRVKSVLNLETLGAIVCLSWVETRRERVDFKHLGSVRPSGFHTKEAYINKILLQMP